ncbi:unnamed protein product [Rotaria sordida]|uniref:NAD(P)(+)--arginine ADP-ribosyltransferase n=1 Tax=Rotaria sordida TaxID=392033 RepID=A0A818YNP9_9BILA|nr:unnamed protein product [Rotaria sordida]CAF3752376.1 unnamed protein product [Rotaria sordida]
MGNRTSDNMQSRYMMDEDENAKKNVDKPEMRLQHCCYVQSVGKIPNYHNNLLSKDFQSEKVEKYLESVILYQNVTQLLKKREEYTVIEDDFGPTLAQMLTNGKKPSFTNLVEACRKFDGDGFIQLHLITTETSHHHFLEKNINEDDAKAYAFAIAFYTGAYSEMLSLNANIFARRWQRNKATNAENVQVDDNAAMIMYYLIKGLSHINFYWGRVVRYVKLSEKDLNDYRPGEIITWLQFSSSDKGDDKNAKHLQYFKERNTKFIIYSLTGRSIRGFSNCSQDEDEVLFLPHSTFLIELGLCKYVVLWVDDHIFDEWWENKGHMEKASTLGTQVNVHFIPKSTTEFALAFLRSEFGKRLKHSDTFRIVTDMNRDNESSPNDAGVRLLSEVRKLGFNQKCLIFTGNALEGFRKLSQVFHGNQLDDIKITEDPEDLEQFVLFK